MATAFVAVAVLRRCQPTAFLLVPATNAGIVVSGGQVWPPLPPP